MSVGERGQSLHLTAREMSPDGQILSITAQGRDFKVRLPLMGAFQASNALVAAGLCIAAGEDLEAVLGALEHIEGRAGPAATGRVRPQGRRRLRRLRPYPRRVGDGAGGAAPARVGPADRRLRRRR